MTETRVVLALDEKQTGEFIYLLLESVKDFEQKVNSDVDDDPEYVEGFLDGVSALADTIPALIAAVVLGDDLTDEMADQLFGRNVEAEVE